MNINLPTIVLALYNRKEPSLRSLDSLSEAVYPNNEIRLVISIDNDDDKNKDVLALAEAYQWKHGEKEVIYHERNLGIREHFNYCGDLTEKYGSVVFIEDDLYVSRYFYDYLLQALDFYKNDSHVAGISLFSYHRLDQWINPRPFIPVDDGSDNFFLQQASWGQVWTWDMWKEYKKWFAIYGKLEFVNSQPEIPYAVKGWPGSSFKKYYISYMILNDKYYVFPRIALATNFDDVGTNRIDKTTEYQSPLLIQKKKFMFNSFNNSLSIYDSYFEILPQIIKTLNQALSDFDFEVNLYGDKNLEDIKKEYVLSRSAGTQNIKQFNLVMKPHELNVIFNTDGDKIFLSKKESIKALKDDDIFIEDLVYFYRRLFSLKEIIKIIIYKIKRKF